MARYFDRVKDSTTTTGTGNITLSGSAPTGFVAFAAVYATGSPGDLFTYCISSSGGSEWEVGTGYLSGATTLVRDVVLASSNSGSAVNFSAGTKDVFVTWAGADASMVMSSTQMLLGKGNFFQ